MTRAGEGGRGRDPLRDRSDRRLSRAGSGARPRRGPGIARALLPPAFGRRRRRLEAPRLDRRRAVPQRPHGRLRRLRVPVNRNGDAVAGVHGYRAVADDRGGSRSRRHLRSRRAGARAPRRTLSPPACARSWSFPPGSPRRAAPAPSARSSFSRSSASHGARLLGPNCLGIASSAVHLNATFAPRSFPPGKIGFSSQSGALGLALLERAEATGLGVTSFVSVGNKADVSSNDLLEWWEDDDETEMVVLYLESFGNPRAFVAHRAAACAPQADPRAEGRQHAGGQPRRRLAHGGARRLGRRRRRALPPGGRDPGSDARRADRRGDAALRAAGAARAAGGARHERRRARHPRRRRVRGRRARAAAAERRDPRRAGRGHAAGGERANPIDLLGGANAESFAPALPPVLADPAFDAAIVLFVPTVGSDEAKVGAAISTGGGEQREDKPVLCVFVSANGAPPASLRSAANVPCFDVSGGGVARARRARPSAASGSGSRPARCPSSSATATRPRAVVREAITAGGDWLDAERRAACSRRTAFRSCRSGSRPRRRRPSRRPNELGYPVVLKTAAPGAHKTEQGGVVLDLGDEAGRPRRGRADRRGRCSCSRSCAAAPSCWPAPCRIPSSARSSRSARAASWPS